MISVVFKKRSVESHARSGGEHVKRERGVGWGGGGINGALAPHSITFIICRQSCSVIVRAGLLFCTRPGELYVMSCAFAGVLCWAARMSARARLYVFGNLIGR